MTTFTSDHAQQKVVQRSTTPESLDFAGRAVDQKWVHPFKHPAAVPLAGLPQVGDPMDKLIAQWVGLAARHARVRRLDGEWIADVVGIDGAWADGPTMMKALDELVPVLEDWVRLKLEDGDRDIPPMEGLRLVVDA